MTDQPEPFDERIDEIIAEPEVKTGYGAPERVRDAWKAILATRNGRVVARDILQMCHYGLSPFEGDVNQCVFTAGKQKVGEEVMGMINSASPESYNLMTKEAKEDEDYDNRQHNTGNTSSSTGTNGNTSDAGSFG